MINEYSWFYTFLIRSISKAGEIRFSINFEHLVRCIRKVSNVLFSWLHEQFTQVINALYCTIVATYTANLRSIVFFTLDRISIQYGSSDFCFTNFEALPRCTFILLYFSRSFLSARNPVWRMVRYASWFAWFELLFFCSHLSNNTCKVI